MEFSSTPSPLWLDILFFHLTPCLFLSMTHNASLNLLDILAILSYVLLEIILCSQLVLSSHHHNLQTVSTPHSYFWGHGILSVLSGLTDQGKKKKTRATSWTLFSGYNVGTAILIREVTITYKRQSRKLHRLTPPHRRRWGLFPQIPSPSAILPVVCNSLPTRHGMC